MAGGAGIEFYLGGGGDLVEQDLTPYKNYYLAMTNAVAFFQKYVPFTKLTGKPPGSVNFVAVALQSTL